MISWTNWWFGSIQRSHTVSDQLASLRASIDEWTLRLRQLRQFYFLVAEQRQHGSPASLAPVEVSSDDEDEMFWLSCADHLPSTWRVQCLHCQAPVPGAFLVAILEWLCAAELLSGRVRVLSDVEFVFALALDADFQFPCQVDGSLDCTMRAPSSLFQRPTLGALLTVVQLALNHLSRMFPHLAIRTPPKSVVRQGLYMKFAGLRLFCPDQCWRDLSDKLRCFTRARQVRRTSDLARPMP
eukprot:s1878_g5.t1